MMQYENEFSSFPFQKITKHNFQNMDDHTADIIKQINELRSQGLYDRAAAVIDENREILSRCTVDAVTFRTWEEEIYNAQKYARQLQQSIYFEENEEDVDCFEGDVWLGGA